MPAPELFTPDGYSPALADLDLSGMHMSSDVAQVLAIEGLMHKISQDNDPRRLLEAVEATLMYRGREWGDCGVEKSTHYAHLLASTNQEHPLQPAPGDTTVWLHDYRRDLERRARVGGTTIENDHTHRGSVSSIILHEGFTFRERRLRGFEATERRPLENVRTSKDSQTWLDLYNDLEPRDSTYGEGDVMHIDPDEVHGLKAVADGTLSLVVRPTFRPFSVVYIKEQNGDVSPMIVEDMPSQRHGAAANIAGLLQTSRT